MEKGAPQGMILCSTGAVTGRANGGDLRMPAKVAHAIPCDGWELLMTTACYAQEREICRAMKGLHVPVFHTDKRIGESVSDGDMSTVAERFAVNCRLAKGLGATLLVHHLWGGMASDGCIGRNIASYPMLRDIADRHGLTLTIENVVCNQRDPMTHLRTLADRHPDILFTFDTKMAAFHSQLEALYLPENAWIWPRIAHLHVNDYVGGHMDWANMSARPLGAGHIDFDRFFAFLREIGYAGSATYEATALDARGVPDTEQIARSLHIIRKGLTT